MRGRLPKCVSFVMAVFFPFAMMAADSGAMAYPTGKVSVNGTALSAPAAVFAGDKIRTDDGSMSMTVSGSTVQVGKQSAVVFNPSQLSLSNGGMKVSTTSGLAGQVRNLSLRPEGTGKTVYTVAERNGKVMIAALEGNLTLSDGHGQIELAANHAVAIPVAAATQSTDQPTCKAGDKKCEKAVKACKGDKACESQAASAAGGAAAGGAAAGGAAAGAGAGAAAGLSTGAIVGISVAAAAAAAGIGVGIAKANESSSPSKP
jgi:hypothetical protein